MRVVLVVAAHCRSVCVAYAGPETKLSLNQREPPFKYSSLDKRCGHIHLTLAQLRWPVGADLQT
jgi:hypothetical protein